LTKKKGVEIYSTFESRVVDSALRICRQERESETMFQLVNFSTIMWAIVPEFLTLLMNIFIIQKINVTTRPQKQFYPTERTRRITQATRVVLALSIIFIVFNSPTGLLIIIDLIYTRQNPIYDIDYIKQQLKFIIYRKYVLMLYETNFIASFPIYIITIKNFK
jgi:hypothetical protein